MIYVTGGVLGYKRKITSYTTGGPHGVSVCVCVCDAAMELTGSIYTAIIFGEMSVLITSIDKIRERYRERLDAANEFIKVYNLPPDVMDRVHRYIDYSFTQTQGISTKDVADGLPEGLRTEIFMFLHAEKVLMVSLPTQIPF